jgi:hypothetical protein
METYPINFPLLQHIPSISTLSIPNDKYVLTLDDISDRDALDIQLAFFAMLGSDSTKNKYYSLDYITEKIKPLYKRLNRFDVILAPGDSPAKFINVFRLCGFDVSKFVQFPVSGLGEPEGISDELQEKLDEYMSLVLENVDISETSKITLFDYVSSGASIKYIRKSLAKLFPNTKIHLTEIQTDQRHSNAKLYSVFNHLMIEGEIYESRAVRYYPISSFEGILPPLEEPNLWKCNLICMTVALRYLGRLEEVEDNNPGIELGYKNRYKCSYFDFEKGEIKQCVIATEYEDDVYAFDPTSTKFKKTDNIPRIKLSSVLQITGEV